MSRVHCVKPFPLVHSFNVTERAKWRGQCSTYVCLDRVWKQQSPSCYSNNRRQRLRDQSSIASTDVMLLVAFTHWRGQAEFGVTLMCHLDLDTSFHVGHRCGLISASVHERGSAIGFLRKQEKMDGSPLHNPTWAGFLGRHGAAEAGALWLVNGWV